MDSANDVRLIIGGREFRGWQGVSITQNVDALADAFSISAPWNPDNTDARKAFAPFSNRECSLFVGHDLVITGILEKPAKSFNATDRTLTAEGRSKPGKLVDCYLDGSEYREGVNLAAIFWTVCNKFGVTPLIRGLDLFNTSPVSSTNSQVDAGGTGPAAQEGDYSSIQGDGNVATKGAMITPGEKALDYLTALAQAYGFVMSSDEYGRLVIGRPVAVGGLLGRLFEADPNDKDYKPGPGEIPILSASAEWDGSKRFRGYKVFWSGVGKESAAQGQLGKQGTPYGPGYAADPGAGGDRYFIKVDTKIQSFAQAVKAADILRTQALAEASAVSVTVAGWRAPWGGLWRKSRAVHVYAPSIDIRREVPVLIAGVTMRIDDTQGLVTDLRLVPPWAYSGTDDVTFSRNTWGFE